MRKKSTPVKVSLDQPPPILPEDLIIDHILPRLPVKSLLRFKCVSRSWLSTISSQQFHKTHFEFSSKCPQAFLINSCSLDNNSHLISFDEYNKVVRCVRLEFDTPLLKDCNIVGSCDGLVCLYDNNLCFYLWNPATSELLDVDEPKVGFNYGLPSDLIGYGFGYVSSIEDYRIACILTLDEGLSSHVFIFSSKARKWDEIGCVDFGLDISWNNESVLLDDTLYWSPHVLSPGSNELHIGGLNLVNGKLNKFPLMNMFIGYNRFKVFQMKGSLTLGCEKHEEGTYYSGVTDVWIMKQQDDWSSWEKMYTINLKRSELHFIFETGKCLIGWKHQVKLLDPFEVAPEQYDESTSVWEDLRRPYLASRGDAWGYHESLISLDTITSDGNEDDD